VGIKWDFGYTVFGIRGNVEQETIYPNSSENSKSWTSLASSSTFYDVMPDALKTEVLVRSRVESPDLQKERSETVKTKTVTELSQIHSLSDLPLPKQIENILHSDVNKTERPR